MRNFGYFGYVGMGLILLGQVSPRTARAQSQPIDISVDGTAAGTPLNPVWPYYGYDEDNYTTMPEGKRLLKDIKALNAFPVHIRTHFLLNTGDGKPALKWGSTNVYTENAQGQPVYDWTLLDGIMDGITAAGNLPLAEIAFMPKALSSKPDPYQPSGTYVLDGGSFYPPNDYSKWAGLIGAWAEHSKTRYPGSDTSWLWQLWNEPDIGYWHGTHAEYFKLFDYTEGALHGVMDKAVLGGPEVTRGSVGMLKEFLDHCATGINAVTQKTGTRLDMVTFHAKGGVAMNGANIRMDLGSQLRNHRDAFATVHSYPQFRAKPIVIGEADPDGCAACPASKVPADGYRNVPAYGAYEVAMMAHSLELADSLKVNLKGLVTWAFTFPGSPYFSGYRELANNGIHKPVLEAFKMLGKLQGQRIPLKSSGARGLADILTNGVRGAADVDGMAVKDGDRVMALIWNYHDDLAPSLPASITLNVSVPATFPAQVKVTHYRMDSTHSNAYSAWLKMGGPQTPTAAQTAQLQAAMALETLTPPGMSANVNGKVTLAFTLPRHGISLVILDGARTDGMGSRTGPRRSETRLGTAWNGNSLSIRDAGPHTVRLTDFRGNRLAEFHGPGPAVYTLQGFGKGLCLAQIRTPAGTETRRLFLSGLDP